MLIDTLTVIPLRWWHLTMGEKAIMEAEWETVLEPWELANGYFVRDDHGELQFCEDVQEH